MNDSTLLCSTRLKYAGDENPRDIILKAYATETSCDITFLQGGDAFTFTISFEEERSSECLYNIKIHYKGFDLLGEIDFFEGNFELYLPQWFLDEVIAESDSYLDALDPDTSPLDINSL